MSDESLGVWWLSDEKANLLNVWQALVALAVSECLGQTSQSLSRESPEAGRFADVWW